MVPDLNEYPPILGSGHVDSVGEHVHIRWRERPDGARTYDVYLKTRSLVCVVAEPFDDEDRAIEFARKFAFALLTLPNDR